MISIEIRKCDCGYTMKTKCEVCGKSTRTSRPPKFSPEDKYGKYRRMAKNNI